MITLQHVSFCYADGTKGVDDVTFTVRDGECVVLIGPSGGGKTTITRLLNGLAPAYYPGKRTGKIQLYEKALSECTSWEIGREIGSVFQDPQSQFFSSELAGEVAFACENYGMPGEEIRSRTDSAIEAFGMEEIRSCPLDVLSSGEKQRVAIASVYALRPHIYVCDEPTANLDNEGARKVADVLRKLKNEGSALIIAEHRLAWLFGFADRYLYISEGRMQWEKTAEEMRDMSDEERRSSGLRSICDAGMPLLPAPEENGKPALLASGLTCKRRNKEIFRGLCLSLNIGQITALTGKNGAGKTSIARILTGLWKESGGEIFIDGRKISHRKRKKEIWYSANDTGTQFFTNSVTDELFLGLEHSPERLEQAGELLKRLGLYDYKDAHPAALSGGQKQRLSIACGIFSDRKILIFDEPTSGLDGGNMEIISKMLRTEADRGKTILVITHDEELMRSCCDCMIRLDKFPIGQWRHLYTTEDGITKIE